MTFDGYRVPAASRSGNGHPSDCAWHAVLVWCGRKPSPKFCATKEELASSPYFQGGQQVKLVDQVFYW